MRGAGTRELSSGFIVQAKLNAEATIRSHARELSLRLLFLVRAKLNAEATIRSHNQ